MSDIAQDVVILGVSHSRSTVCPPCEKGDHSISHHGLNGSCHSEAIYIDNEAKTHEFKCECQVFDGESRDRPLSQLEVLEKIRKSLL